MATTEVPAFGDVLSHYRVAAGLTQEELAERANLSVRGISDLERGVRTRPQPMTVRQLAQALQLSPQDRAVFEEAAHASGTARRRDEALPEGNFLGALPSAPLVGRGDDVERMSSILDAVVEGSGHVLFLSGELGVGKTRLLQELMVAARTRDFLVLTGRCYAAEQETSYDPFLEALGGLAAVIPRNVRTEGQRGWKRVQQLMAAAGSASPDVVQQQQLCGAVTDFLLLVARSVPLALLLDDLQWADSATLKLLQHLARTTRSSSVLLAAAFRDLRLSEEEPVLAQTLQILVRERLADRVTVRRLSLEETTTLAAATMGQEEVSEEFAHFVYRRTKGIPRLIDQLVRSLGGRLELQGEIGAGAMGRVFRALDRTTEQTVAAKLVLARQEIDLDTLLRFQQEGAVLTQLDHPHIVDIHDTFVEEHASCIIMELLEGQSLGRLLQEGPLPFSRAKNLGQQVAEALNYAHSQGIVHRDIKPDNVMVLDGDQVKVTDFGIARILQPDTSLQTIATTGMRLGTPLYMAPEQIEGKKIDARTDVYALGAMLYHMVTGRPPFEGSDALTVAVKHLQEDLVPPSQINPAIPADWDVLILKAMAKDPAKRFQSAREMEEALRTLGEPAARRLLPAARPQRVAAMTAMMALLLAVLAGVWVHNATSSPQPSVGSGLDAYLSGLTAHQQLSGTVLVAQKGKVLLDKGYGLADRQDRVANGATTRYPIAGVNFSISLAAALKLEEQGALKDGASVCSYLSSCPFSWRPMTIHMLVDGTSGLDDAGWGQPGHTTAQSMAHCQAEALTATPGTKVNYQNCTVVVLGTIIEKVTGKPWATAIRQLVLQPAAMTHSGRVTDSLRPPARAEAYSGRDPGDDNAYNDYFQLYSTAQDVYAYDSALSGGRLLSKRSLDRLFAPRTPVEPPDPGVDHSRVGYKWKIGTVFGHRVIYTTDNTFSFTAANAYLPGEDVSIVVISNDDQNDVEGIAVHLAGMVVPKEVVAHISPGKAIAATIMAPHAFGSIVTSSNGALWVGTDVGNVLRIDPSTNQVIGTVNVNDPSTKPDLIDAGIVQVASGSGQLWAVDRIHKAVVRIDPATDRVVARVPVGIEPFNMAIASDTLWVVDSYEDDPGVDTIVRIDLGTDRVVATITNARTNLGEPFLTLAASRNALWFIDWQSQTVKRLDPATNKVVATIRTQDPQPSYQVVDGDSVWVASHFLNLVTRIDARTNKVIASIPLHGYPSSGNIGGDCCGQTLAVGAGAVWIVAGSAGRTLVRIDPQTDEVTAALGFTQSIGHVAVSAGSVWVGTGEGASLRVVRIDPAAVKGS